jgi:hypothetical protein
LTHWNPAIIFSVEISSRRIDMFAEHRVRVFVAFFLLSAMAAVPVLGCEYWDCNFTEEGADCAIVLDATPNTPATYAPACRVRRSCFYGGVCASWCEYGELCMDV